MVKKISFTEKTFKGQYSDCLSTYQLNCTGFSMVGTMTLTHFRSMYHFYTPENVRK